MIRKLLFSFSLLSAGLCLAAPLSPEEALSRLDNNGNGAGTRSVSVLKPIMTYSTKIGEPALYVFTNQDEKGFKIVSADDAIIPLLGYSDNNSFDPENMSPAMQDWLEQYAMQSEYARENGAVPGPESGINLPSSWNPIAPLVKTTWNQGTPYNDECPIYQNRRTYTGCVATAMAQVMNYFKYPETGQGSITFNSSVVGTITKDFSKVTFDWANMLDTYKSGSYNQTQAEAVANLMVAAGCGVKMNFTTNQSGTQSGYIPGALVKYFKYDPSVRFEPRNMYDYTTWATMLYNNLKNVGPVIYDGTAPAGGHSFVCDGYQSDGYFHFNWGWSGSGDGYFLLDSLNPSYVGIGGALGGFNFIQDMILNIQPYKNGNPTPQNEIALSGSLEGAITSSFLRLRIYGDIYPGYKYYGLDEMTFDVGIQVVEANNSSASPQYFTCSNNSTLKRYSMPLDPGYVLYCDGSSTYPFPMFTLSSLGLQDNVKYKVTTAYKPEGGDWEICAPSWGSFNYFYITKSGSNYEVENFPQMQLTCTGVALESPLYDGNAAKFKVSLTNKNDIDLTRGATLLLIDENGNTQFVGDSFLVSLSPGESYTREWTSALTNKLSSLRAPKQFYIALRDEDTQSVYYKSDTPVTMQPSPGAPQTEITLTIDNGVYDPVADIYTFENPNDMQVTVNVDVIKGFFSYPVKVYVMSPSGMNQMVVNATYYLDLTVAEEGTTLHLNHTISYPEAQPDVIYFFGVVTNNANQLECPEVPFFISENAGVEEIGITSEPSHYDVYNISGVKVASGDKSVVDNLPKGLYIINGKKVMIK